MIKDYAFHPKQQWMARVLDALRRAQPALGWSAVVLVPVTGIAASVTDAAQERSRELARATAGLAEVAPDLTCSALPLQDRDPPADQQQRGFQPGSARAAPSPSHRPH